jgi:5'-nucleotidase (lipoprotein e(P4) family)
MKKIILSLALITAMNFTFATGEQPQICASDSQDPAIAQSLKWYRISDEKVALYRQSYLIAEAYVKQYFNKKHPKIGSWGVVLDIDETVLDNSWYPLTCNQLLDSKTTFYQFVANAKKSKALPGAVRFTNVVHNLGGYVSLVSNRDGTFNDNTGNVMVSTIENLQAENIYFDQVVLANAKYSSDPTNKNLRFNAIVSGRYNTNEMVWSIILPAHKVIAYVGDNIQDFPKLKQSCSGQEYKTRICLDEHDIAGNGYNSFGAGYFIVPNPIYGSWMLKNIN